MSRRHVERAVVSLLTSVAAAAMATGSQAQVWQVQANPQADSQADSHIGLLLIASGKPAPEGPGAKPKPPAREAFNPAAKPKAAPKEKAPAKEKAPVDPTKAKQRPKDAFNDSAKSATKAADKGDKGDKSGKGDGKGGKDGVRDPPPKPNGPPAPWTPKYPVPGI